MSETISHAPVPEPVLAPNQFEIQVPRNDKGERIGTGAIIEHRRPMSAETVGGALLKALSRATRRMEEPRGSVSVAEHAKKHTGLSFVTEQERTQFAARTQQERQTPAVAQVQPDAETTHLVQADRQQTEQKLDATRSAIKNMAAKPQPQDKNERAAQPAERKAQKEPETTEVYLRDKKGNTVETLTLPKNYTRADLTRAIQSLGGKFADYEAVYDWKTPQGLRTLFKDMWKATKKAWQASAPPEAQQPGGKAA